MERPLRYQPEEIAVLEQYLDRAFPFRSHSELLPHRGYKSIQKRLNRMRRAHGTLYRVRRDHL